MHTYRRLISIARAYAGRLLLVALLTSMGAMGELVEPWVYRAIINDIAGVFVSKESGLWPEIWEELRGGGGETEPDAIPSSPTPSNETAPVPTTPQGSTLQPAPAEKAAQRSRSRRHQRPTLQRLVQPSQKAPMIPPRTVSHAIRTLWVGVLVLLAAAALAKCFAAWGDLLAAKTTNEIEENSILRAFRRVLRLPLSYFTQRPSGAIARPGVARAVEARRGLETAGRWLGEESHRESFSTEPGRGGDEKPKLWTNWLAGQRDRLRHVGDGRLDGLER